MVFIFSSSLKFEWGFKYETGKKKMTDSLNKQTRLTK